jgi:thiol-disulfide isomerase/thioredoxin
MLTLAIGGPSTVATGVLEVSTLDGEHARLADYFEPGRRTLVMIWTTYCEVCASEFPRIEALHQAHSDKDLKVLGLAADGLRAREAVRRTLTARAVSFDSVIGERAEIAAGYHRYTGETFAGTPTYLLFGESGELAAHLTGPLDIAALEHQLGAGTR